MQKLVLGIIIVVALGVVIWFFFGNQLMGVPSQSEQESWDLNAQPADTEESDIFLEGEATIN